MTVFCIQLSSDCAALSAVFLNVFLHFLITMGNNILQTILEFRILQEERIMTVFQNYATVPQLIYYQQYIPGFRANLSVHTSTNFLHILLTLLTCPMWNLEKIILIFASLCIHLNSTKMYLHKNITNTASKNTFWQNGEQYLRENGTSVSEHHY